MGEVKEPGRFELSSSATVLDVLAMAKGFNEFADKGRIIVLRRENGVTKQYAFQYMRLLQDNAEGGRDNFYVQPGDIVLVR
jgi:polysaccharide export outer membrane protein